jgi:hypothetical protein
MGGQPGKALLHGTRFVPREAKPGRRRQFQLVLASVRPNLLYPPGLRTRRTDRLTTDSEIDRKFG